MTERWDEFFPPGTRVLALPNWRRPRLYLPAHPFSRRWDGSRLYPASRWSARLYRLFLRANAAAGLKKARTVDSGDWRLGNFAEDVLPELSSVVVLVGTPGPAQKITAQLRDVTGRVLGYLKYAETETARSRIRQEHRMLSVLPVGVGPRSMKFGPLGNGEALLSSVVPGELVSATLPPPREISGLLDSLIISPPEPLESHPWVRQLLGRGQFLRLNSCLEALTSRDWPIAIQHGDFAPWNVLRRPNGDLGAIDWEYGAPEGLPYLDLAYYALQTSALIYRREPLPAARYTSRYLARQPSLGLDIAETQALTRLAAYDAYLKALEDGQPENANLQTWRRKIWEDPAWSV